MPFHKGSERKDLKVRDAELSEFEIAAAAKEAALEEFKAGSKRGCAYERLEDRSSSSRRGCAGCARRIQGQSSSKRGIKATCGQLLDSRLSESEDVSAQTSSWTNEVGSMIPIPVIYLPIAEKVSAYRKSLPDAFLNKKAIKMSKGGLTMLLKKKIFISPFFVETALKSLNQLLQLQGLLRLASLPPLSPGFPLWTANRPVVWSDPNKSPMRWSEEGASDEPIDSWSSRLTRHHKKPRTKINIRDIIIEKNWLE
jgi:hypothetical protein